MSTIKFTHRNLELDGTTRQEKINSYIRRMGGSVALTEYIILNLQIIDEDISEIETIE